MSEPNEKNWPKDEFGKRETRGWLLGFALRLLAVIAVVAVILPSSWSLRSNTADTVIVYCAQDQTYAEPILRQFEDETGLRVKAVYDSEAVKTVGLANRLLVERDHPQCDVFWGNEEMRTRQLGAFNVWRETNGFASFGARTRCLVVNTNRFQPAAETVGMRSISSRTNIEKMGIPWKSSLPDGNDAPPIPVSLFDLTNAVWRGKVAMAFPQFGTTATHFHVLRQHWGDAVWQSWCRGLVANDAKVLDGNSTVVKMIGRGEAWIGLTDTDDVAAGLREGLPVMLGPDLPGTLLFIPNTVGIVRGAPHPENAQKLADYLQRPETVARLLDAGAVQYAEIPSNDRSVIQPDWDQLLRDLDSTTETLNEVFLR